MSFDLIDRKFGRRPDIWDNDRQDRIDAAIRACTECGGRWEFPKRYDCDGCAAAVDEEIEAERMATAAIVRLQTRKA
jgi:hypothetical protein